MKQNEESIFSKNSVKNPREWWKKSKFIYKPYQDRSFPCKDGQKPEEVNEILYEYWKEVSKDKSMSTTKANEKFKNFEFKVIHKYGFKGHSEL